MTIGFAMASWLRDDRVRLHVAADTLISKDDGSYRNENSVKTLDLDDGIAAVFAGSVAPPFIAAEMARGLLRSQMATESAARLGLFDVARLVCHFTRLALSNIGEHSELVLAGYLRSGTPALARILVTEATEATEAVARVAWILCPRGGSIAIPVGPPDAKRVLLTSMARAKLEGESIVHAAVGSIEYMMRHQGKVFSRIGGQASLGVCEGVGERFRWPAIILGDRTYWRGMDVTGLWRRELSVPFPLPYDETWHAETDQRAASLPLPEEDRTKEQFPYYSDREGAALPISCEDMLQAPVEELFRLHPDPPALQSMD